MLLNTATSLTYYLFHQHHMPQVIMLLTIMVCRTAAEVDVCKLSAKIVNNVPGCNCSLVSDNRLDLSRLAQLLDR